jgi:hypothetical protein
VICDRLSRLVASEMTCTYVQFGDQKSCTDERFGFVDCVFARFLHVGN